MPMPNEGEKQVVNMSKWVMLFLYDMSGGWTSKSISTVIAPSLCALVILGLPILLPNKIVIDHEKQTVIAKDSRFDLLNPKLPSSLCATKKIKENFHDLQEACKVMVAALKMVCEKRACKIKNYMEEVKPVDHVVVIRSCLEELNAQDQLN